MYICKNRVIGAEGVSVVSTWPGVEIKSSLRISFEKGSYFLYSVHYE